MQKSIISIVISLVILSLSGCGSCANDGITPVRVLGAATDDYIVGGDVALYRLDATSLSTTRSCKTGDFGLFECSVKGIASDETILVVVSGGRLDKDGNSSTKEDQQDFTNHSLMAFTQPDKAIIVSPFTSKVITQSLEENIVIDTQKNLVFLNKVFVPSAQEGVILSQKRESILQSQENLPIAHILKTQEKSLLQQQVVSVTQLLENNISLVEDIALEKNNLRLQILHINDTHSHLEPISITLYPQGIKTYVYVGGYAKIATFIKKKKAIDSHSIALDAGDSVQGTLYYTLFDGKADVEALNGMDLDAMTIGNHEFDKGAQNFAVDFASQANFSIISADINASANSELKNIIKPYIIKEIDGEKIAIVGDSIDASVISNPGASIVFANYLTSAQKSVDRLQKEGINKIIFLTHLGYITDKYLAQQISDIDIIVGGHSHTLLGDFTDLGLISEGSYPTVVHHENSQTLIVSAYKWGEVVGDLNVVFNEQGVITQYNGTPVMLVDDIFLRKDMNGDKVEVNATIQAEIEKVFASMSNIEVEAADSTVKAIIESYKPQVDDLMHQRIAIAAEDLINVRLPGSIDPESGIFLAHGSMIAPHVALAMYEKAKEIGGCDFALQNVGGVRISIPQGDITIGEVYTLLPFGNTLVTFKMKGDLIKIMLENAIDRAYITQENMGAFPYLAGAKFTFSQENEKGSRIVAFQVKNSDGEWVDFDTEKTYTIATNAYVAGGGDYYSEILQVADKTDTGFIDAEIFIEYLQKVKVLQPLAEDLLPVTCLEVHE